MKILISEFSSGFREYASYLSEELSKISDNIVYYITDINSKEVTGNEKGYTASKVYPVFSCKCKKYSFRWLIDRYRVMHSCIKLRKKYVEEINPDIMMIPLLQPKYEQKYIKMLLKKTRVVLIVHDVIPPQKSFSWDMKSLKKVYSMADGLVVHSNVNKQQLARIFEIDMKKIHVIPHGLVSEYKKVERKEARKLIHVDDEKPVLLFFGGVRETKGLDILIKSLEGLECYLVIAGAMPYGESFLKYRKLIDNYKIDTFEKIEYISEEERNMLFQACDYVVLPYKEFYSQSGVLIQATRYKIPVIATDVSSFADYIETYKMGYICKPDDVQDLKKTIEKALNEINRREVFAAHLEEAAKENSWERVADKYNQYLKTIILENKRKL